jgi:hypothetical protein
MPKKKSAAALSIIASKAVRTRKKEHPGGSCAKLDANEVRKAFRGRKSFSTGDIMREFGAAVGNATAITAALRARGLTEKVGVASDGTSSWRWL